MKIRKNKSSKHFTMFYNRNPLNTERSVRIADISYNLDRIEFNGKSKNPRRSIVVIKGIEGVHLIRAFRGEEMHEYLGHFQTIHNLIDTLLHCPPETLSHKCKSQLLEAIGYPGDDA